MKVKDFITLLPRHFYPAFLGELVSIFGPQVIEKDEYGNFGYDYEEGTGGWYHAFKQACIKIGQKELCKQYNSFDWMYSDQIDSLISMHFDNLTKEDYNNYYKFLVELHEYDK